MYYIMYRILTAVIGILLFIAGITDIRKKQISRKLLLALLLVCIAAVMLKEDFGIFDAAGGLAIGLCAIGISMVSREQIGMGDGIVIAVVGLVLGTRRCLAVVSTASFLMCIVAIAILIIKKGNRHTRLAFLPALFIGYALYGMGG